MDFFSGNTAGDLFDFGCGLGEDRGMPSRRADRSSLGVSLMSGSACLADPRGAHDLIIAATARATDRLLVSTDAQDGCTDLPEVEVRLLTP